MISKFWRISAAGVFIIADFWFLRLGREPWHEVGYGEQEFQYSRNVAYPFIEYYHRKFGLWPRSFEGVPKYLASSDFCSDCGDWKPRAAEIHLQYHRNLAPTLTVESATKSEFNGILVFNTSDGIEDSDEIHIGPS